MKDPKIIIVALENKMTWEKCGLFWNLQSSCFGMWS